MKQTNMNVINRSEMLEATLSLGGAPISLADYAATGLMALAIGPRGNGKTNCGLLISEQLAKQGWVSVLIDPEGELESMYGKSVTDADELYRLLKSRTRKIIVVAAKDATEFVPFGNAIIKAADEIRKPLMVMIDEGQIFSATNRRKEVDSESVNIIKHFAERGRKRAIDVFITTHRYTGSLHRSMFSNKNLTLVGCQEDPAAWSGLAPQFKGTNIGYSDLNALSPGEFFCFSRRGMEKIQMPMAEALAKVAPKAKPVKRVLPKTYSQWDRAMRGIANESLNRLTDPVVNFLGAVAGLNAQQMLSGSRALQDEMEIRA